MGKEYLFIIIISIAIIYYIAIYVNDCINKKRQREYLRSKTIAQKEGYKVVFDEYVKNYLLAEKYLLQIDVDKELLCKMNKKNNQNEIIKYVRTTGENEFYKELLGNEKWESKSKSIIKRDVYCQHCFGLIQLDRIDSIMNYVDFPEIGNIIIDIFQRKEYFNEGCRKLFHSNKFKIKKRVEVLNEDLYILEFSPNDTIDNITWKVNRNFKNGGILSSTPLYDISDLEGSILKKITREYTYKMKGQNGTKEFVDIEYFPNVSTDGRIYLRHRFSYSRSDGYGQGIISQDGFSVIFPLYNLNNYINPLQVHHKAYREGKNPWESPDDELITLCSSCHKKEHTRHAIPVY